MAKDLSSFRSEVLSPLPQSMVASAVNLTTTTRKAAKAPARRQDWQVLCWGFYDTVGEYRYGCNWVGNLLSQATLYIRKRGQKTPVTSGPAFDALQELFGGEEGQTEMLRQLGVQFTVAGEAYIFGTPKEQNPADQWRVSAATQVSLAQGQRYKVGNDVLTGQVLAIRMWKPHPERADESDSPSRAVIPTLAEIDGLSKRNAAVIDSRLAGNGILAIPSEMSLGVGPKAAVEGEDATPASTADQFLSILQEAMLTAIGNREDASAVVPIVVQIPGDFVDKIKHITFSSDLDENAPEMRKDAIGRLALGMDMPPEVLTGTGDLNHWNAWAVDEASVKAHTEPLLQVITNALTTGYLWPALQGSTADYADYTIEADTSKLRLRPNRSKEAQELWDRGQLSGAALLRENGFDPEDAMGDKERTMWFIQKVASGSTTPDLVAAALNMIGANFPEPTDSSGDTQDARPTPSLEGHPTRDIPDQPAADQEIPEGTAATAEAAVFRALERVGNRIKNRKGYTPPAGVDAIDLYQTGDFGDDTPDVLLAGAWDFCDRLDFGVERKRVTGALDLYVRSLLATRQPHSRQMMLSFMRQHRTEAA